MTDESNQVASDTLHFRVVSEFAARVLSLNTESDVLWHLTHNVVSKLGFEDVVVYIFDAEKQRLVQKAAFGKKSP